MERTIFYIVIESQVDANGNKGLLYQYFDEVNAAYAKFYTILASAAVSALPYHAGILLNSSGISMECRVFDRREPPAPQPEPEE